jgi:tripartite-type tricarboxylate transporter receptor subunit TctC
MKPPRSLLSALLCALALMPLAALAQMAKQPLRLVVGYPAGGSADAVARLLADKLRDEMGTAIIVDNRAGAGGQIAADHVRTSPPDGNTVLVANSHMMVMLPLTTKSVKYSPSRDFSPVIRVTSFYEAVTVATALPASSVAQWLELARKDGKGVNYGVPAPGSVSHFLGYRLGKEAKVDLQAIPYRGAAPAVQDLLGGQLEAGILPILDVVPHHQSGKLKVLAVNGNERAQLLPDVPTLKELGIAGFETLEWTALLAPAGTPKAVVDQLNAATRKVLAMPDVQERLLRLGMQSNPSTPEALAQLMADDLATWGPVVKASGFTAD